jgi:hypothetical protein
MHPESAAFWNERLPLRPSPTLDRLVDRVLLKRSPKWKFRIAPDFAVELQAKVKLVLPPGLPKTKENTVTVRIYYGRAFKANDGLDAKVFFDKRGQDIAGGSGSKCRTGYCASAV